MILKKSPLGQKTRYDDRYDPSKLFFIPRKIKRDQIGISKPLPFFGFDIWNHYEVSWLNEKGKPVVALAKMIYSCDTENIIESKSMKLYFNSLNNTKFKDVETVKSIIEKDIKTHLKGSFLSIEIMPMQYCETQTIHTQFHGINLDVLDIACSVYHVDPHYLITESDIVSETVCSDLLKSNCLITHQPDWCSLQITYQGKKINHEGLLRYIVSFRDENEFHEQCIEKIFMHILQHCHPNELTVYGRSTRRGGIDINAYRSTQPVSIEKINNTRLCRQ